MTLKAILLDFDGTLADTRTLITNTMLEVIEQLGLEKRTAEQCASMIGLPLKDSFTRLIPMTDRQSELCVETYNQVFCKNNVPGAVPLFVHVPETLHRLHDLGYTLTLASSRSKRSLTEFVEQFDLGHIISCIVSAGDVVHGKPHPETVHVTLRALGIRAEEALVVGDTVYDIEMGQAAGIHTCGVTYGNGTRRQMEDIGADYVIDDFNSLLDVVNAIEA